MYIDLHPVCLNILKMGSRRYSNYALYIYINVQKQLFTYIHLHPVCPNRLKTTLSVSDNDSFCVFMIHVTYKHPVFMSCK